MESLQLLKWDTDFFGFPIGKIINPKATNDELQHACNLMRFQKVALAYWAADKPSSDVQNQAGELGAQLVDEKLTFVAEIRDLSSTRISAQDQVQSFRDGMSIGDLKQLAIDSGVYSRFIVDPIFPNDKAIAMFEEWIVRSVAKSIADEVLVIADGPRIAGMATIVNKGTYASIGLVAVAEGYRGRQFGEALVRSAQDWCREHGIEQIQVTTQNANVPARRLYQKCQFDLKTTEHFYHFWNRDLPLTNEFRRRRAVA